MKVNRFILLDNGRVIDIVKNKYGIDEEYNCLFLWDKNMDGYLGKIAKPDMDFNGGFERFRSVTATANNIFDLIGRNWIVYYHGKGNFVYKNERSVVGKSYNLWLGETGESEYITSPWYPNIQFVYAPVTENEKITRYELVWEWER